MWTNQRRSIADSGTWARFKSWAWLSRNRWRIAPDPILGGVLVWDRQNMQRPRRFSTLGYAFAAIELAEHLESGGDAA